MGSYLWCSREEGVAGVLRTGISPTADGTTHPFRASSAVVLLHPVYSGPKPAEPLRDGTVWTLAEPSNSIKPPVQRQDFHAGSWIPRAPMLPNTRTMASSQPCALPITDTPPFPHSHLKRAPHHPAAPGNLPQQSTEGSGRRSALGLHGRGTPEALFDLRRLHLLFQGVIGWRT